MTKKNIPWTIISKGTNGAMDKMLNIHEVSKKDKKEHGALLVTDEKETWLDNLGSDRKLHFEFNKGYRKKYPNGSDKTGSGYVFGLYHTHHKPNCAWGLSEGDMCYWLEHPTPVKCVSGTVPDGVICFGKKNNPKAKKLIQTYKSMCVKAKKPNQKITDFFHNHEKEMLGAITYSYDPPEIIKTQRYGDIELFKEKGKPIFFTNKKDLLKKAKTLENIQSGDALRYKFNFTNGYWLYLRKNRGG